MPTGKTAVLIEKNNSLPFRGTYLNKIQVRFHSREGKVTDLVRGFLTSIKRQCEPYPLCILYTVDVVVMANTQPFACDVYRG